MKTNEGLVDFLIDYGLPGKPEYEYTRPFDYYSLQASASSANGFENMFVRGLLLGRRYDVGSRYHGVWGLYGNYDYIAPQTYRVSPTGMRWHHRSMADERRLASRGNAHCGRGYTAAGTTGTGASDPTIDNHYHYAPRPVARGPSLRVHGDRLWRPDFAGREYTTPRAGSPRGGT